MKERRYHLPESSLEEGMLGEPSPSFAHAHQHEAYSSAPFINWDEDEKECNADGYPLGRSLKQVMEHCAEIDKHLDDPNYGIPIEILDAEIDKMIAECK